MAVGQLLSTAASTRPCAVTPRGRCGWCHGFVLSHLEWWAKMGRYVNPEPMHACIGASRGQRGPSSAGPAASVQIAQGHTGIRHTIFTLLNGEVHDFNLHLHHYFSSPSMCACCLICLGSVRGPACPKPMYVCVVPLGVGGGGGWGSGTCLCLWV